MNQININDLEEENFGPKSSSEFEGNRREKGLQNSMEYILKWNQNMFAKILILKSM